MDASKRKLLKMLPMAALAVRIGCVEATATEVRRNKKYILKLPAGSNYSQRELNVFKDRLIEQGFPNVVLVQGDVEIFEAE